MIEVDFLPDIHFAARHTAHRFAYLLSTLITIFVAVGLYWAHGAVLEEVTRGEGRVIPSSKVQVVQNLEGGILSEMLVSDGQTVVKDELLLRIANTKADSDYQDSRKQYLTLEANIARLDAESFDKPLAFPKEILDEAPALIDNEKALYETRQVQLRAQISVIKDQIAQRQSEIVELQSKADNLARSLGLARQEKAITEPLVARGSAAKLDLIKLERQVSDLESQISEVKLGIPRAQAALAESQRRVQEKDATFRAEAAAELSKRRAEFATVFEKIRAEQDRVTRTEVRSPVRGIIKEVKINTIGGVIRPGQDLVEIVPLEDTLLIEARVRPADIAFLRPGQDASVKITAYDYSIYGGLKAHLEQISADTLTEEKKNGNETFFRVTLRTEKNFLGSTTNSLPIIPGMTATVDILTGHKTVLDYLLKPILKAKDRALRER